ncbi:MAG: chemotaxis protein CheA [Phycisphaerales bacterium]|nr:chemotaxis protein CheA [Phycisphaerales bacterium]MCB9836270.1 chemotaxis protein CheA [Phycisphaera sp.]
MIETQVQKLAKAAAMVDPMDLPALVALGELFNELCSMLDDPGFEPLSDRAKGSADLLERIVMHEVDDLDTSFAEINSCIEYAQELVAALSEGLSLDQVPMPRSVDADANAIDQDLLDSWISGCGDILDELESLTIELESEPNSEKLAEVRRGVHTLKGECGVLSLAIAQKVCHEAETLIDACESNGESFPANEILAVLDWIKTYTKALSTNPSAEPPAYEAVMNDISAHLVSVNGDSSTTAPTADDQNRDAPSKEVIAEPADNAETSTGDPNALVQFPGTLERDENLTDFLTEAREHIAAAEEAVLSLENDLEDLELINTVFRSFHTIKGVAGFMNLTPIVHAAHNAEYLLDEARKQTIKLNSSYLDLILESCDVMSQLLGVLEGGAAPKQVDFDRHISQLQRASKGEPVETGRRSAAPSPAEETIEKPSKSTGNASQQESGAAAKKKSADVSVKVNTERLDNLVTMVGELVIAQQMVIQDPSVKAIDDQRFQRNMSQAGKIIRDLQEVAMSLRMVTLKGTFQKMARLVRDVSAKANKSIQFVMEGEDTELDRTVVEEIGDPLVHMIRNSCDHGIESAEDRVKVGKPATGTLALRAYHQGGSIIIEIQDDGKGLDRDRILAKAIEKGIYTPERDLKEIPDSEVFNLIMLPGFSTAPKVTDISGRGVGMDVVRRNIEALRGKIEINSVAGKGTTFRLSLPLTMAIIDGMIVRVGTQRYVVPTLAIEQSFRPTKEQIHTVVDEGEMALVRDSLLPVYRLNRIFDLKEGTTDVCEGLLLVMESNGTRCCMLIDEIIGQQQVVIKRLGQGIEPLRGTSGGAILGDGRVALIIDVAGLLSEATQSESK